MLKDRVIKSSLGIRSSRKLVTRGISLGGLILPLLWNLVVDKMLLKIKNKGIKLVA